MSRHIIAKLSLHSRRTKLAVLLLAILLTFVAVQLTGWLMQHSNATSFVARHVNLLDTAVFLVVMPLTFVVHELIHAGCYKLLGARNVVFGLGRLFRFLPYLYTSAPKQYFRLWQMLIVGLTPLILLNLAAVTVCVLYPHLVVGSITVIVSNTIGACADVYLSLLLCYYGVGHPHLIIKDTEDGFELLEETTHK